MRNGQSATAIVCQHLQQGLAAGRWRTGEALPSERELALQLEVSRPTVRAALIALIHEGRLQRSGRAVLAADGRPGEVVRPVHLLYSLPAGRAPESDPFLAQIAPVLAALPDGLRLHLLDSDAPGQWRLPDHAPGGVIVGGMSAPPDSLVDELAGRGIPALLIGARTGQSPIPEVRADHRWCGEQAALHLLAHGHRRIALLDGPADHHPFRLRREGFLAAGGSLVAEGCAWDRRLSREAALALLDAPDPPTALAVGGDHGLTGVADAIRERGATVPAGLAVLAIGLSPFSSPPLALSTAAFQADIPAMARRAARLLAALRVGETVPTTTLVPYVLRIGRSCGCVEPPTGPG